MTRPATTAPSAQTKRFDSNNRQSRYVEAAAPASENPQAKTFDHTYRRSRSIGAALADGLLRASSFLAGTTIIAASAFAVIDQGQLTTSHAALVSALSLGCIVGSVVATRATRFAAASIVAALLAGEAFNFLSTGERVIAQRASVQRDSAASNEVLTRAKARLALAEKTLAAFSESSRKTVAEKSCRSECRALLEKQLAGVQSEVSEARRAVETAPGEVEVAPLAARLHVSAASLDLIAAGLLSFGGNVLGMVLIGFGARPGEARHVHVAESIAGDCERSNERTGHVSSLPKIIVADDDAQAQQLRAKIGVHSTENEVSTAPTEQALPEDFGGRLIALLESRGGELYSGHRPLAKSLGCSSAHVGNVLRELEAEGKVSVRATKTGTVVRLSRAA